MMVWMTLLAAYCGLVEHRHVGMDALARSLPEKYSKIINILAKLTIFLFVTFAAGAGWQFAVGSSNHCASTMDVSMFWVVVIIPVGFTLMAFDLSIKIAIDLIHMRTKTKIN